MSIFSGASGSSGSSMAADLYAQAHKDEEMFRKMQQEHVESKGKLAKMIKEMSQKELDVADLETGILINGDYFSQHVL